MGDERHIELPSHALLLEDMPIEVLTQIYMYCTDISSVVSLSSTCRRLNHIYRSSRRLAILFNAADTHYGPIYDIIRLVTHNASQPVHIARSVPYSDALLTSVLRAGCIAAAWEERYPYKKWRNDYENRRLLTSLEKRAYRKALYRLWLYSKAFHSRETTRTTRMTVAALADRSRYLHNLSNEDLAQMLDVHDVFRQIVGSDICPSNGTVRRRFKHRFPNSTHQLLFNSQPNYHAASHSCPWKDQTLARSTNTPLAKYIPTTTHEPGNEGWGDDISHYYVVKDMLKLDPEQLLYLRDNAPFKAQVEAYIREVCGTDWFENNGETFAQTLDHVLAQRGIDLEQMLDMVSEGLLGVAVH